MADTDIDMVVPVDTEKGAGAEEAKPISSKLWLDELKNYERAFEEYHEICDKVDALYSDLEKKSKAEYAQREFQLFWANIEIMKEAIYSRPPIPVVVPRFKDRDPLRRHASEMLERAMSTSFEQQKIHEALLLVRDDLVLPGRGVLWHSLSADRKGNKIIRYRNPKRRDFAHQVARSWDEVGWVGVRDWLTREQGVRRFGEAWLGAEFTERLNKDASDKDSDKLDQQKAGVWEIWDKENNVTVWVTPGVEDILDIGPPIFELDDFFPCPKPAYATLERETLKPVPDLAYYKDQLSEINLLTARISALGEALRLKGLYSAGVEDLSDALERAIKQTEDNAVLIPVPNTAALGGQALKDAIIWLPITEVAETIVSLIELRKQMIQDVYEITGLSDIVRGTTDPNETLGAQRMKSQYSSIRIQAKQRELQRIARDSVRISGEIISENFSDQELFAMSQYDKVPTRAQVAEQVQAIRMQIQRAANDPEMVAAATATPEGRQQAEQAVRAANAHIEQLQSQITFEDVTGLLRDQRMRPYMLEIETDSTIQVDEQLQQEQRTKFLAAMTTTLSNLAPLVAAQPDAAPFAAEVLKFAVSPFRGGRELDAAIDEFAETMKNMASQASGPSPEQQAAMAEMQAKQQELTMKMQEMAADIEKTQAETDKIVAETERIENEPTREAMN